MLAKTHGTIALDLSVTQDPSTFWTCTVRLECTFAEPLEESISLTLLNQFETSWEITFDGSILLDFAPWTQIK